MPSETVDKNSPIPRYLQVKQLLEKRIRGGEYTLGGRIPGERDLALELQVSQMTVNKAVLTLVKEGSLYREHGNGTFVSQDHPLNASTELSIGIVVNISAEQAIEDFYLGSLFRGMQLAVANGPVSLSIMEANEELAERLAVSPMDGLLFVSPAVRHVETVRSLHEAGKRVVVLGAQWETMGVPFVDSDNRDGTRIAVEHLIKLGHRRIAGVFTLLHSSNTRDRLSVYQRVLAEHQIDLPAGYLVTDEGPHPATTSAQQRVQDLLRTSQPPTAFLGGGFYMTLDIIRVIREAGLNVPEDISVVGFDDPVSAAHLAPPLTTVRQPLDEMGRRATQMLIDWCRTHIEPERGEVLPTTLIIRSSTSPVNTGE